MKTIGDKLESFRITGVKPGFNEHEENGVSAFEDITESSFPGKWKVIYFYPKDFTFVCPTEIKGFADVDAAFRDRDCRILAASTDSEFVHLAWRRDHKDLRDLPFPMLADINKDLSRELGILDQEGVAKRATFLVDPEGVIRFVYVTEGSVGRNPAEVLRVLDALQTDELCPCNRSVGGDVLRPAA